MDALQLLMWSILLYVAGGVASLLLARQEDLAIKVAGLSAMAGGLLGLASAVTGLTGAQTLHWQAVGPFAFAHFIVRMDSLAAFMVLVISLLVTSAASIRSPTCANMSAKVSARWASL